MGKTPSAGTGGAQILAAARRVLGRGGLAEFKARSLGESPSLIIHHFGSMAGLLGAVAAAVFNELADQLEEIRLKELPERQPELLSLAHVEFALSHGALYQAIHSHMLWGAAARGADKSASSARARQYVDEAHAARARLFNQFIGAVALARKDGAVGARSPDLVAHLLTALGDGFIFQCLEERIMEHETIEARLRYYRKLLRIALQGVAQEPQTVSQKSVK